MTELTLVGIIMNGRITGPADKYYDPPPGPTDDDVIEGYERVDSLLRRSGLEIVEEKVKHLPHIEDGFISASAAASAYLYMGCIIINRFHPFFQSQGHIIYAAGLKKDVWAALKHLKAYASWEWEDYWFTYLSERKVYVSGDGLVKALPDVRKALE